VTLIAGHYNARPDVGKGAREASPIIGLKNFNNWVKSVLILRFAHPALAASPRASGPPPPGFRARGGKVLDMGCGKGGDLSKWARAPVAEYVGVDIAAVSVDQARARWADMRGQRFQADFAPLDCFVQSLADGIKPARLARAFDVVSMQFCMHYAFETPAKARRMLENVGRWLRKGGVFVGTIPNAELLMANLDAVPEGAPLQWGNGVYSIAFEARTPRPAFGHRYRFFLRDAVDDVPEYVVRWQTLVALAAEQGLHPVYHEEFHQVYAEHADHAEYGPLLVRMKVQDAQGESQMDEEQWEAASECAVSVGKCMC
jgi:mRNA (guanine-N7-)-methyltransferase